MHTDTLYEIARLHRDRAWSDQTRQFGEWEPPEAAPTGSAAWWYSQGKAEAFAAIMSEIEGATV